MTPSRLAALGFAALLFTAAAAGGSDVPLAGWTVPRPSGGIHALTDIGQPGIFVAIAPCRVADTRVGSGFTGSYGAPAIAGGTTRTMNVTAGVCTGIPSTASAVSFNFTVTNTQGPGDIRTYPAGGSAPLVSTLNYVAGQTIANATIVPLGTGGNQGSITIQADVSGTDLVVDMNGYFVSGTGTLNAGEYLGVVGSRDGAGVLSAMNTYSSGIGYAIVGAMNTPQDTSAAIVGVQFGSSGRTYGVEGLTASIASRAAGVYGRSGGTFAQTDVQTNYAAGVRGEGGAIGVIGITKYAGTGVYGAIVDPTTGAFVRGGAVGTISYGVYSEGDFGGTGAKYFVEPHPEDPSKIIRYVCLEGPEAGTYFRGRGRFVGGVARIEVPESFRMVTDADGITVQITPIGRPAAVAVTRAGLDGIEAEATCDVEFAYLVHGVRKAYRDFEPLTSGTEFRPHGPQDRLPAYLTEEAKRRLVANGTYHPDGTVNAETAERLGWARAWREAAASSSDGTERSRK